MDRKAFFLFVGDVNVHHEESLESSTANLHGRAAREFVPSSACEQVITRPTHVEGEVLDLVLTDVPDVEGVRVSSPGKTSDHSAIFIDVMLKQPSSHLVYRQELHLKNSVG